METDEHHQAEVAPSATTLPVALAARLRHRSRPLLLAALLATGACAPQPHTGWEPPLERTSTRFLQQEAGKALRLLDAAREDIPSQPARARQHLTEAARALQRLTLFYLPLLEARDRAYDAHRLYYYERAGQARAQLEEIEKILRSVADSGGARMFHELTEPLDLTSEALAAITAAPQDVPRLLESLTFKLNYLTLKGNLVLPEDWPQQVDPDGR